MPGLAVEATYCDGVLALSEKTNFVDPRAQEAERKAAEAEKRRLELSLRMKRARTNKRSIALDDDTWDEDAFERRLLYHEDPAICFGDYVLGWTCGITDNAHLELKRLKSWTSSSYKPRSKWWACLVALGRVPLSLAAFFVHCIFSIAWIFATAGVLLGAVAALTFAAFLITNSGPSALWDTHEFHMTLLVPTTCFAVNLLIYVWRSTTQMPFFWEV